MRLRPFAPAGAFGFFGYGGAMNVYQMLGYETLRTLLGPWLSFVFRIRSEGTENVPEVGGALLISNHRSILDPLALMNEIERYIHFTAGSHGVVVPMVKTLYRMTGMVRLSSRGGKSPKGVDEAVSLLSQGELVGIFPEGIESFMKPDRETKVSYFRTGFARVAIEARVPIVPAVVIPGEEVKLPAVPGRLASKILEQPVPGNRPYRFLLYRNVLVRVGKPIHLDGYYDEPLTKSAIDTLSGKLRRVIIKLYNGQELDRFMTGKVPFDIYTDRV